MATWKDNLDLYLIRHGESESNVDPSILMHKPDHAINLTPNGHQQAAQAGEWLANHIEAHHSLGWGLLWNKHTHARIRVYNSSYYRARQTAQHFISALKTHVDAAIDVREEDRLCEVQGGARFLLSREAYQEKHPEFQAAYEAAADHKGGYWVRPPGGESYFDVCNRLHQFCGTLHRDTIRKNGPRVIVVPTHGLTSRAFVKEWMNHPAEWMEQEPNPNNCAIRWLSGGVDKGYIFNGFENPHRALRKQ